MKKERSLLEEMRAAIRGDLERSGVELRPPRTAEEPQPEEPPPAGEELPLPGPEPPPPVEEELPPAEEEAPEEELPPEEEELPPVAEARRPGILSRIFRRRKRRNGDDETAIAS